jgi:hypothetical protein
MTNHKARITRLSALAGSRIIPGTIICEDSVIHSRNYTQDTEPRPFSWTNVDSDHSVRRPRDQMGRSDWIILEFIQTWSDSG